LTTPLLSVLLTNFYQMQVVYFPSCIEGIIPAIREYSQNFG